MSTQNIYEVDSNFQNKSFLKRCLLKINTFFKIIGQKIKKLFNFNKSNKYNKLRSKIVFSEINNDVSNNVSNNVSNDVDYFYDSNSFGDFYNPLYDINSDKILYENPWDSD